MGNFYFESDRGCGIRSARNLESAKRSVAREVGEGYVNLVRKATEHDVAWVRGMGGYIPVIRPARHKVDVCPACHGIGSKKVLGITLNCSTCHGTGKRR